MFQVSGLISLQLSGDVLKKFSFKAHFADTASPSFHVPFPICPIHLHHYFPCVLSHSLGSVKLPSSNLACSLTNLTTD